jgi:membrane protease YdiL (CAAX protease family)
VTDGRPAKAWHVFVTYGAGVAVSAATTVLALGFLRARYPDLPYPTLVHTLPALLVGSLAASSGLLLALLLFVRPLDPTRFRLRPGWETGPVLAVMTLGVLALSQTLDSTTRLLGLADQGSLVVFRQVLERAAGPELFTSVLVLGFGAGIAEEVFFRGYMQSRLREHWPAPAAVLVTSAAFALLHLSAVHVALAFVLGLYLGFVADLAGSALPSIVCHVANNVVFTLQTAMGFAVLDRDTNLVAAAAGSVLVVLCVLWLRRATPDGRPV